MIINEKIKAILEANNVRLKDLAEEYGTSLQYISTFTKDSKVPLSFIIFLKEKFPSIDLNKLVLDEEDLNIVAEERASYGKKKELKEEILEVLDKVIDEKIKRMTQS